VEVGGGGEVAGGCGGRRRRARRRGPWSPLWLRTSIPCALMLLAPIPHKLSSSTTKATPHTLPIESSTSAKLVTPIFPSADHCGNWKMEHRRAIRRGAWPLEKGRDGRRQREGPPEGEDARGVHSAGGRGRRMDARHRRKGPSEGGTITARNDGG
jgi:hypothetical protein